MIDIFLPCPNVKYMSKPSWFFPVFFSFLSSFFYFLFLSSFFLSFFSFFLSSLFSSFFLFFFFCLFLAKGQRGYLLLPVCLPEQLSGSKIGSPLKGNIGLLEKQIICCKNRCQNEGEAKM